MTIDEYLKLSPEDQREWSWNADDKRKLEIKQEFLRLYDHEKIVSVEVCGYGLPDHPCVYIEVKSGKEKLILPKDFMQRTVIRKYLDTGKVYGWS